MYLTANINNGINIQGYRAMIVEWIWTSTNRSIILCVLHNINGKINSYGIVWTSNANLDLEDVTQKWIYLTYIHICTTSSKFDIFVTDVVASCALLYNLLPLIIMAFIYDGFYVSSSINPFSAKQTFLI